MTNILFHNLKFELKGIPIPEFDIESGKLIRLCVPNFDSDGNDLVGDFRYELLIHLDKIIPKSKWSKEYSKSGILNFWKYITVENYIISNLNTDKTKAKNIAEYLELDLKEKVDKLFVGQKKALAIKCDFEKYETLIFDYYGVGANEFKYLERIVGAEIDKGKSGIVIDRLEYNQNKEMNKNIYRVAITVGNNVYHK